MVSVIVPVYKVEKYLKTCIESILNQSYQDLEIILVDDGSPDSCPQICDEYAQQDVRIKVLHKENGGQGLARNAGLDIATGDYVLFVDSDDYVEKNMVEELVKGTNCGEHDIVLCGTTYITNLKNSKMLWYEEDFECDNDRLIYEYVATKKIIRGPCAKLFRKSLFDTVRFPDFRACEDEYLLPQIIIKCESAKFIKSYLYNYIYRFGSTMNSGFNENRMLGLKSKTLLRDIIKEKYPQYLRFVIGEYAEMILYFLKYIYQNFLYSKYKNLVEVLEQMLQKEQIFLREEYEGTAVLSQINDYFCKPKRLKVKWVIGGCFLSLKKMIKCILNR